MNTDTYEKCDDRFAHNVKSYSHDKGRQVDIVLVDDEAVRPVHTVTRQVLTTPKHNGGELIVFDVQAATPAEACGLADAEKYALECAVGHHSIREHNNRNGCC